MISRESALETLSRFNIDEEQLLEWQHALGLEVPHDPFGNPKYSRQHLQLFKNIKRHVNLGYSLSEIKKMMVIPKSLTASTMTNPISPSIPDANTTSQTEPEDTSEAMQPAASVTFSDTLQNTSALADDFTVTDDWTDVDDLVSAPLPKVVNQSGSLPQPVIPNLTGPVVSLTGHQAKRSLKRFATPPVRLSSTTLIQEQGAQAGLLILVDRLMAEKDDLQNKCQQMEQQKLHLLQTNRMFQVKLQELDAEIAELQSRLKSQENLKLIDDKSRLQKQLLDAEKRQVEAEAALYDATVELQGLRDVVAEKINPQNFLGNWLEEAQLAHIAFDNFGMNIESSRNRMFKINHMPQRCFGNTAVIETQYDYQANQLWKRTETLIVTLVNENRLEGELIAEYILDGSPVAKAIYKVKCHRNGVKPN